MEETQAGCNQGFSPYNSLVFFVGEKSNPDRSSIQQKTRMKKEVHQKIQGGKSL
jgi:hypothetical protein